MIDIIIVFVQFNTISLFTTEKYSLNVKQSKCVIVNDLVSTNSNEFLYFQINNFKNIS